ncbi:HD domain-containing protein [Streptomyces sp. R302]|uniref:HD domain-containing protein n=1 Tax=unclassified Streptomyces TaxID=2593676 RepID=UPI00145C798B|nr:HD domain-containing protein [Streptomyces sp. R301]NML80374.1 HD domain-containing protein [Streptomyces sp. R302]
MEIPSYDEIRALHRKHAPSDAAFELVFTHCEIVAAVAEQLLSRHGRGVDADLVRAGCLLHDIGVYRLYDSAGRVDGASYVTHGVLGHRLLAEEGLPETLCRFCSCHTGVGLTQEDVLAQGLPIPPADYVPVTPEERMVMYADKFHSKSTPPRFVSPDTFETRIARFGPEKVTVFQSLRRLYGDPELDALAAAHGHAVT